MSPLWTVGLPVLAGYAVTLVWIWQNWMLPESYYSHGPLLPLVAAFIVWRAWPRWQETAARWDGRGWWLLGPGLLLHVAGAGLTVDSLSALSLCLTVPGAVLLSQGMARTRVVAPALGLLPFAVPMPMFVTGKLVFVLKEVAVDLGLGLANFFGAQGSRINANILIEGQDVPLIVADACGGLRSLVSLMTVGYVVAFFLSGTKLQWRFVLLAAALPIAILSNVLRIAAMCWMSRHYGVEFGAGTGHDIANVAVWLLALGALLGLDALLERRTSGASGGRS